MVTWQRQRQGFFFGDVQSTGDRTACWSVSIPFTANAPASESDRTALLAAGVPKSLKDEEDKREEEEAMIKCGVCVCVIS